MSGLSAMMLRGCYDETAAVEFKLYSTRLMCPGVAWLVKLVFHDADTDTDTDTDILARILTRKYRVSDVKL